MKSLPCLIILLLIFVSCSQRNKPIIEFKSDHINLGTIQKDHPAQATFKLYNRGNADLLVQNIETDCGCSVADWNKDPIKSNDSTEITIHYTKNDLGHFQRIAYVYANVDDSPIVLIFRGKITE